ncbi:Malonyl CoA-acyl carrier protein transacylase [hydrothermal vent metagenome]|uniref:[acyl-carrier-protein] S-malonyltransferase n=1 Tax=hydrothermal vent metagenome TaxID=652676 RepID=A0A3B0ZBK9_9ZZZZ
MTLGFVFPGQGSQSVGMLAELGASHSLVSETFKQASEVLGYDLWAVIQNGPQEKLDDTVCTQPAMLAAGVAVWRIWQALNYPDPDVLAGHSLGEYTALVCSGALSFDSAIKLVEQRGRFMQEAVPAGQGAMAAVLGLPDEDVLALCKENAENQVLDAVNFNSPGQVVIAGNSEAVHRAVNAAKAKGAKRALVLPVSVPSHCLLMKPAADKLASYLKDVIITTTTIPVISNVNVVANNEPEQIKDALVKQLYQPVRWVETIQKMSADGVTQIVECGPGKVLAGLTKRINKEVTAFPVFDKASLEKAVAAFIT